MEKGVNWDLFERLYRLSPESVQSKDMEDAFRVRNIVAIGLGVLWIIDGLLQLQPNMFTQNLAVDVIANALMSLPSALYVATLKVLIYFIAPNIAYWNLGFAVLQLALGISLIFGSMRVRRFALVASVIWGVVVWVFGEGMAGILSGTMAGGVFPGTPSILNGFPGAAMIYVILGLLLLLPLGYWTLAGRFSIVRDIPAVLFFVCAMVQTAPLMWSSYGQASIFAANIDNLPVQFAGTIKSLIEFTVSRPVLSNLIEIGACATATLGLWLKQRWGYVFALCWISFIWWFGLGLGGTLTGLGTDPNTPPAIALLMVPLIVYSRRRALVK